jgi:hypothetical protein
MVSGRPVSHDAPQLLSPDGCSAEQIEHFAEEDRLWAILDACGAAIVLQKAEELGPGNVCCLFKGKAAELHGEFAPFLARADGQLVDWVRETLWTEPWGVFVVSSADLAELRDHLRGLLIVEDAEGQQKYFRYYDPRVLETFLPGSNPEQLEEFFGPADGYIAAGAWGREDQATFYTLNSKE